MYALLAPFVLALSLTAAPVQSPSAQQPAKKAKKVWTNDDLDALRGGPRTASTAAAAPAEAPAAAGGAATRESPREKMAKELREKLAPLRVQLDAIDAQIKQTRDGLNNPFKGSNAVGLANPSAIMRPADLLQQLQQKRQDIQQKISDLEDEARRNGISPGDIR